MASLIPAQIELANSLTQEELPTKLRCAVCSKLAVNAFRLPCCETAICESCQSTLPSSCPVCEHSPVSGTDCTIYKSLRTTIRVFLKTEEKKREGARPKTITPTPATPSDPAPTPANAGPLSEASPADAAAAVTSKDEAVLGENETSGQTTAIAGHDAVDAPAHPEQESFSNHDQESAVKEETTDQDNNHGHPSEDGPNDQAEFEGQPTEETEEAVEAGQDEAESGDADMEAGQDNANESSEGTNNFGDMNQMQMMMAMQNGMNPAAFGSFPMMGMGMGMDPMAMQNMFMNGGFGAQGMGMNGMNMNMGMNGFNGGNNDWNGQQSWNVGQDNFNPNAAGMGNGDFGNFNSGFRNGYNSGNFGHNQYNDFGRGGYGFRGRGRGRGFYNRGFGRGYHQGFNPRHFGQDIWAQQISQENGGMGPNANGNGLAMETQNASNTDEFGRTVRPDSEQLGHAVELTGVDSQGDAQNGSATAEAGTNDDPSSTDPYPRARSQGTGSLPPTTAPDVPLNAPTGPKAMRQGLPNTSALHLRARGFMTDQQSPISGPNGSVVQSPLEEVPPSRSSSRHEKESDPRHPERDGREHDHNEEKGKDYEGDRPRTRSRSRSRDRKESRRHRRHRSESATGDEREGDHRRRKHKSRRPTRDDDDHKSRSKDEKHDRSRSVSPERERERERERDHKRSSHRSHRDRDRERGERESDYDRHDRHKKSSHRSRHDHDRERSRDRGHDRDREREKDRKERHRDRDRDRDRDREYRHRSRKTSAEPPTPVEGTGQDFDPPSGPRGGMAIRGVGSKSGAAESKGSSGSKSSKSHVRESESSSRRPSKASASGSKGAAAAGSSSSGKDPHTLEREARDRERLLKEAQRMAGLAGLAGIKRGRDAGDERGSDRRRKSRRSEAVYDDEEERMRRLEAEREGNRWD